VPAAPDAPADAPTPAAPAAAPRSPDAGTAASPPAPTATAPDAAAVLRRAEKAFADVRSMRADFVQDLTVPLLNQSQRSRGTIYHRRPDRFLMKFSDPAGDVVVADGTYLWTYYPSSQPDQVVRAPLAAAGQQVDFEREFLERPVERFNSTLDGEATVAGRPAYLLTLVPKEPAGYQKVRIWVDRDDALVRRFEITEQNESVRRIELRDLAVNLPLGDDLFRFTPPAGAQVFTQ
jgi:outer membrane lipoprotein carrier protein